MKTQTIRIGGMTCVSCRDRIEKTLKSTVGVEEAAVNFNTGTAAVTYNASVLTFSEIKAAIEKLGYTVLEGKGGTPVSELIGTLVIILALYVLLRAWGIGSLTSAFPLAEAGMGYGMLFVIGLITSVHCVAMCGGINLSQCIPSAAVTPAAGRRGEALFPAVFYNAGRVVSYTAAGVIAGALGQAVTVSGRFRGIVQLTAGVFMVIMGINMLGIFQGSLGRALRRVNPRMPKIFTRKMGGQRAGSGSPLLIGLLNGLMPCGPLQAMQLYALSTGSPVAGGISMFLFSMGTVPLMFGIGALSSALSRKFTHRVMKVGAILVTVMGMTMFTYGYGLSGFSFDFAGRAAAAINPFSPRRAAFRYGETGEAGTSAFRPVIENGVQIVNSTLSGGRYPAITVQQGIPVKWTINAPAGSINGCNNRMIIREYRIEHRFAPGENVIEFTPERAGRFPYSCWMGMIRSSITVVEEGESVAAEPGLDPSPAGVVIPTDRVVLAEMRGAETYGVPYQAVTVSLRDDGIEPALIVLQRGVPALWTVHNDSLDPGNSALIIPAYYSRLDIEQGDNLIQLMPAGDFDFSTGDNVFYGYVKVVDDLAGVDPAAIEAIQTEVAGFETHIYPDVYFEATSGGGCCGGMGG
ncbi:MAG: sulfite exporter TauE/SafE family protein [Treponema sp.]|jgi:sulfite exporter TauE/SafE/copper chaperone CopZ/plastocyanin domain-containing protein|nr:sulfite exporter TauE/SafE family protein [Treponema sp.]